MVNGRCKMKGAKTLIVALAGIALLVPVVLAWYGGPGPAPWCPSYHYWHHGPWWAQTWTQTQPAQPVTQTVPQTVETTAPQEEITATTTTIPAYSIGGPFCSQCHAQPPVVNAFWHTGRYVTVSGTVVKSAPGIAVITTLANGTVQIYHIRFPYYCQPPKPGTQITVHGWEGAEARLGELYWHMVSTQGACPTS